MFSRKAVVRPTGEQDAGDRQVCGRGRSRFSEVVPWAGRKGHAFSAPVDVVNVAWTIFTQNGRSAEARDIHRGQTQTDVHLLLSPILLLS